MSYQSHRYRAPRRAQKSSRPFLIPLIILICLIIILIGGLILLLRDGGSGSAGAADPVPSDTAPEVNSASPSPSQPTISSPPDSSPSVSESPSQPVVSSPEPTPSQPEKKTEIPWYLTLVNNTHPLPEDFEPELAQLPNGLYFDIRAKDALMDMFNACRDAGLKPVIGSAYRSIDEQIYLHNRKINFYLADGLSYDEAYDAASQVVAIPGCSEHNLGLAVDLCALSYQILDEGQLDTAEQQWFMEHCHEYGFILRYPLDKTEITGIIFEPWHYRYVGVDVAKEITESGLTLEEYMEQNYVIE